MESLSEKDIRRLFDLLNEELALQGFSGELYLVGGAVMCLVYHTRAATKDIDAIFVPVRAVREAAARVGEKAGVETTWLNDAVKGFISDKGAYDKFLELSHLRVFAAQADYLLAMKCLSMRIGREFHDEADVRYLLRYLNIDNYDAAITVISQYYPLQRFPQKTLYALEEILNTKNASR